MKWFKWKKEQTRIIQIKKKIWQTTTKNKPLNNRLITWDKHMYNHESVAGLSLFVSGQSCSPRLLYIHIHFDWNACKAKRNCILKIIAKIIAGKFCFWSGFTIKQFIRLNLTRIWTWWMSKSFVCQQKQFKNGTDSHSSPHMELCTSM